MQATWWDRNVLKQMEQFQKWIGDFGAPSKVAARQYVISKGYASILDVGCGTCSEYHGYKQDAPNIAYMGVDSCQDLVDLAAQQGIENVVRGDIESLPFADNAVEVVFIRHVLEHLEGYQLALSEAIRVASREVIVIWFLPCTDGDAVLNYDEAENLRHNRYQRQELEQFIQSCEAVEKIQWQNCGNEELEEEMLHIVVKSV